MPNGRVEVQNLVNGRTPCLVSLGTATLQPMHGIDLPSAFSEETGLPDKNGKQVPERAETDQEVQGS